MQSFFLSRGVGNDKNGDNWRYEYVCNDRKTTNSKATLRDELISKHVISLVILLDVNAKAFIEHARVMCLLGLEMMCIVHFLLSVSYHCVRNSLCLILSCGWIDPK